MGAITAAKSAKYWVFLFNFAPGVDKRGNNGVEYAIFFHMAMLRTWFRVLMLLLVLPVIAVGGGVCVCDCRHQVVYAGRCDCDHGHAEEPGLPVAPGQQHRCFHVENELQAVSGQVEVPVFPLAVAILAEPLGFDGAARMLHSQVAVSLERSRLWQPPETRCRPMLI